MPHGIELGTKIAIVGTASVVIAVMRALERYAHIRARRRTRRAIERTLSS